MRAKAERSLDTAASFEAMATPAPAASQIIDLLPLNDTQGPPSQVLLMDYPLSTPALPTTLTFPSPRLASHSPDHPSIVSHDDAINVAAVQAASKSATIPLSEDRASPPNSPGRKPPHQVMTPTRDLSPWETSAAMDPPPQHSTAPPLIAPPLPPAITRLVVPPLPSTLTDLKISLMDVVYGTSRGLTAGQEERAQIEELVTMLEARTPISDVSSAMEVLQGRWKLVYTSNTRTLMILNAIQSFPIVDIGDIYQVIDSDHLTVHNKVDLALPVLLSLRSDSGMEVRSPSTFKVRVQSVGLETYIQTPHVLMALDIPDSIQILGQSIDLSPIKQLVMGPIQSGLGTVQSLLKAATSPDISLPTSVSGPLGEPLEDMTTLWMIATFLDDSLRISRDDSGSMYIFLRD